jgi:Flp pilus assembly protein TadB
MSLDFGTTVAVVPVIGAIGGAIVVFFWREFASKQLEVDFDLRERAVLHSLSEAALAQAKLDEIKDEEDLEQDDNRDHELREAVGDLARRIKRMEAVSERLEVRRQVLLETYHNQGLSQSRVSFGFSLFLGLLGFSVIVYAVLTRSQQAATYISGAVTEAVSVLFFTQSNQARRLMAQFFDKLRDDRRLAGVSGLF